MEMIPEERWQAADETLATLDRRIGERAADLEKLATSRADFLRLLRADRKLELLKLEHDIVYWRLPEERRARHRQYTASISTTTTGVSTGWRLICRPNQIGRLRRLGAGR